MKHINLSNYKGSITDWTELNYINGGLADNLANIANIKVNDSCYNYLAKSQNLASNPITYENVTGDYQNVVLIDYDGFVAGQQYTISFVATSSNITSARYYLIGNVSLEYKFVNAINGTQTYSVTFTAVAGLTRVRMLTQYFNEGETMVKSEKAMLVKGSTAPTAYEPYGALVIHQNARIVDMGTLTWDISVQGFFRSSVIGGMKAGQDAKAGNISTSRYVTYAYNNLLRGKVGIALGDNARLYVNDPSFNQDAQAFKAAMNGVMLKYELANPKNIVLKSVDLGTLNWGYNYNRFRANIADMKLVTSTTEVPNMSMSNGFAILSNSEYVTRDKCASAATAAPGAILIRDSDYTDAVEFKESMNGVILLYEPTE